jgi:hypothetical protein
MKLDCILTATNDNPLYSDFIPMFIRMWKTLVPDADVKIIYIAESIPQKLEQYNDHLIHFPPIDGMLSAFVSQYIRILYPSLMNYTEGVLITDMDIMPMNSAYYVDNIKEFSNDKFIYLRDWFYNNEMAICYNVASPSTWKEVNNINSMEELISKLKEVYKRITYTGDHGGPGWCTDQIDFKTMLWNWKDHATRFVHLQDATSGYKRLDRMNFYLTPDRVKMIQNKEYTDYHACRPYNQHETINKLITELICNPDVKVKFA